MMAGPASESMDGLGNVGDGVRSMVPRDAMSPSARKLRDGYARVPEEVPYEDYLHFRKRCLEFAD